MSKFIVEYCLQYHVFHKGEIVPITMSIWDEDQLERMNVKEGKYSVSTKPMEGARVLVFDREDESMIGTPLFVYKLKNTRKELTFCAQGFIKAVREIPEYLYFKRISS